MVSHYWVDEGDAFLIPLPPGQRTLNQSLAVCYQPHLSEWLAENVSEYEFTTVSIKFVSIAFKNADDEMKWKLGPFYAGKFE